MSRFLVAIQNKFTEYYKDITPKDLLLILHDLDSVSYFNQTIEGFDIDVTDGQYISISFIESREIHNYIKQTHLTHQYLPYLNEYMKQEHLNLARK